MAEFVERILGNGLARRMLSFCTAECPKCGRRMDLLLRQYYGDGQRLCLQCNVAYMMISNTLDMFIARSGTDKEEVVQNLRDPMWRKGLSSVLEGIANYGIQRPFTASRPFLVVWNITKGCNLRCKHCYASAQTIAPDELTTEEALSAIDKMGDAGIAYVALSGGEPLMRSDFWKLVERIRENDMAYSIATNGVLLTSEKARMLKEKNCLYVQISLDGATAEKHDFFRGEGMFERTLKGIQNAVAEGLVVGIAMTVTRHNIEEVPQAIDLAERLGATIFMHYNFIPTGRGKEIINLDIDPEQRENLLMYLAGEAGKRKISLLSTAPQYARVSVQSGGVASLTHFDAFGQDPNMKTDVSFLADFVGGCGTSRLYFAMDYNGNLMPCVFLPIVVGNIKNTDLIRLWDEEDVFHKIRKRSCFEGRCASCEYTAKCGGCRARSYGYYGDVTHSDPGCIYNMDEWEKIKASAEAKMPNAQP